MKRTTTWNCIFSLTQFQFLFWFFIQSKMYMFIKLFTGNFTSWQRKGESLYLYLVWRKKDKILWVERWAVKDNSRYEWKERVTNLNSIKIIILEDGECWKVKFEVWRGSMQEQELDYVVVPLGLLVLGIYHVWLLYTIIRYPSCTVIGLNAHSRYQWVLSIMAVSILFLYVLSCTISRINFTIYF